MQKKEYNATTGELIVTDLTEAEVAAVEAAMAEGDDESVVLASAVRAQRDRLLFASDFTQLSDAPLTPTEQTEWQVYRERLRDVPEQTGFPDSVNWPVKP